MRVEDLHHKELLELDPEGGVIGFAGQRALLLDAVAMGLLRQYLVENFGLTAARAVLTQFGFAHGWRMAEAMQSEFKWASPEEWRRAGSLICTLEGLFRSQPGSDDPFFDSGRLAECLDVSLSRVTETLKAAEEKLRAHRRTLTRVARDGAFTGAASDRPGLFEAAHHGTLLLDEIGDVSPGMQVKLLRVLQEREVRRVGENKSRPVDVRVLAATNRDLAHGVAEDTFRQDLYYRLKVVELHLPPLRDRRDDVLPLARLLLADAAARMAREISGFTPGTADQLLRYDWPGNVRELENAMERAVALARGPRVDLDDLPEEVRQAFPKPVLTRGNGATAR